VHCVLCFVWARVPCAVDVYAPRVAGVSRPGCPNLDRFRHGHFAQQPRCCEQSMPRIDPDI